jgi:hypothetical protein
MAAIKGLGSFQPMIEYVDVVRNNTDYTSKKTYIPKPNDSDEHIRWCRRNLGARGDGWDFAGSGKTLTIFIWSHKLQFMYEMWQQ